jgi:hypothetical protein
MAREPDFIPLTVLLDGSYEVIEVITREQARPSAQS